MCIILSTKVAAVFPTDPFLFSNCIILSTKVTTIFSTDLLLMNTCMILSTIVSAVFPTDQLLLNKCILLSTILSAVFPTDPHVFNKVQQFLLTSPQVVAIFLLVWVTTVITWRLLNQKALDVQPSTSLLLLLLLLSGLGINQRNNKELARRKDTLTVSHRRIQEG